MVKIRGLGFRRSPEKYFPVSWFSERWMIRQAGFKGAILAPKPPHFRPSLAFGSSFSVQDPSTCFKFENRVKADCTNWLLTEILTMEWLGNCKRNTLRLLCNGVDPTNSFFVCATRPGLGKCLEVKKSQHGSKFFFFFFSYSFHNSSLQYSPAYNFYLWVHCVDFTQGPAYAKAGIWRRIKYSVQEKNIVEKEYNGNVGINTPSKHIMKFLQLSCTPLCPPGGQGQWSSSCYYKINNNNNNSNKHVHHRILPDEHKFQN